MGALDRPLRDWLCRPAVHLALLALLALGWLFRDMDRPLTGDSVHYASIAKSMVESGNWLDPVHHERPYFNKPPVAFWLAAASMRVLGIGSRAAMLPSTLAAALLVLALYVAVARLAGPIEGLLAGTLLLFTPDFFRNSATFRLESLLLLFSFLALLALERARERPAWFFAFWALFGAAIMTKSGAGFIPIGVVAAGAIALRDPFPFDRGRFWAAFPLFVAIVVPWYAHMSLSHGGEFWKVHFHEQQLARFAGVHIESLETIRSYLLYPGACLFLAPFGLFAAFRREGGPAPALRRAAVLAAIWIALVFLALLMLKSGLERERYMYYTLAAAAGLAGIGAARILSRFSLRAEHMAALAGGAAVFLLALRAAGVPLEKTRSSRMRDLVASVRLLAPPGRIVVVADNPSLLDHFAHFYFGQRIDEVPLDRLDEGLAARGKEVLALADRQGYEAAKRLRPEVIADGGTFFFLRFRAPGKPP
jgi:4-amino-4-deoxy-L-arabinose transferase-like glycosyltransferase